MTIRLFVTLLFLILFIACSPREKVPETYGIFVWIDNEWKPVAESGSKIDLDLQPEVRFLIHQKAVERYMRSFELAKKVYIRNIVQQDPSQPPREATRYNKWDKQRQYYVVNGQFAPVKGQAEMVVWTPTAPLAAGIYEPIVEGDAKFAFSVNRQDVLASLEDGAHCVDLIKTNFGGIPMGVPDKYTPCVEMDRTKKLPQAFSELNGLIAASGASLPESGRDVLMRVIESSDNPNLRVGGFSLLSIAAQSDFVDVMEVLLTRGADINGTGDDGTPLHWAVASGKYSAALLLIKKGADVNLPKSGGWTPIDGVGYLDDSDPRTKELIAALQEKGAKQKK